jgi:hypothetical protein
MRRNTILLVACFIGAIFAAEPATLRNRLGQVASKSLAQQEAVDAAGGDLVVARPASQALECPCNFKQLPGLGAGEAENAAQTATAA